MSFTNLSEYADHTSCPQHRKWKPAMDVVALFLIILAVHFVIAAFSGKWPWSANSYNSYLLQTLSWLEGRLDLGQNYEWLELAIFEDKFFVSFPPFPSYVYLPFALIFRERTPEGWIAFFVMLLGAFYALRIAWHYLGTGAKAVFWSAFLYVGTNVLYVTLDPGVWFIAQSMALTLSLMAIFYAVKGKGGFSLFFWGCSVGCRPLQVLYAPVLLYILYRGLKKEHPDYNLWTMIQKRFYWAIPVCIVALSYMILNYARFGSIAEFGHNYLPCYTRDETRQFNMEYIKNNLPSLFRLPEKMDNGTLHFSIFNGNCIFLVSPVFVSYFIYLIRKFIHRQKIDRFLLIAIPVLVCMHVLGLCAHDTMGGFHFGHRYINDTLAYVYLAVMMFAGTKETWKTKNTETLKHSGQTETAQHMTMNSDTDTFSNTNTASVTEAFSDIETDSDTNTASVTEAFSDMETNSDAKSFSSTETTDDINTTILETSDELEITNTTKNYDDTELTENVETSIIIADAENLDCTKEATIADDYTYCLHYGLCALGMALNIVGTIATNMGWIS